MKRAAALLAAFTLLVSCQNESATQVAPQCNVGAQFILVSPAPGTQGTGTSNITVVVAGSQVASGPFSLVLIDSSGAVVSSSVAAGPVQSPSPVPTTPPATPAALPSPFMNPVYYSATGFTLGTTTTYTVGIAGAGCTPAPIPGASFTT